jgi:site-specific recombinase XerD
VSAQPRRIGPRAIELAELVPSWIRSLESENKSEKTVSTYVYAVRLLREHAGAAATTDVTAEDLRDFFAAMLRRMSPASVAIHFRSLRVFFSWIASEEPSLMPVSPMKALKAPVVPKKRKPPLEDDDVRKLLATCTPDSFESRRDTAIIRVLADTGMRVSGLAGIRLRYIDEKTGAERSDVHLGAGPHLTITLKGGDEIAVPIGKKSVAAIDRYIRARGRHAHADMPWLWLAPRGRFTHWGIRQMLERRAEMAGVEDVHPHRFRRSFAHSWLESGGQEFDLMKITGWKTRDMIEIYTAELGEKRAATAHARLSPGDRI